LLRQYGYKYDLFGNLSEQTIVGGPSEAYVYDTLHRLTKTTRSPASGLPDAGEVHYAYDAVGNMTVKSDYSARESANPATPKYFYGALPKSAASGNAGPNGVWKVALRDGREQRLAYDANGNLTGDTLGLPNAPGSAGFSAVYDAANLPVKTQRLQCPTGQGACPATTLTFGYGPDQQRVNQHGPQPTQQRLYFDGAEFVGNGDKHFPIADVGQVVYRGGTRHVEYFATDRLGSVGSILAKGTSGVWGANSSRSFDAFGKPRDAFGGDATPDTLPADPKTPLGFTGHEHLDSVRLIHMNGRAYDYNLGRFLSVDPFIQFPLNSQSLNPYSYILNNPLSGTDPTGYQSKFANDSVCDIGSTNRNGCTGSGARLRYGISSSRSENGSQGAFAASESPSQSPDSIGSPRVGGRIVVTPNGVPGMEETPQGGYWRDALQSAPPFGPLAPLAGFRIWNEGRSGFGHLYTLTQPVQYGPIGPYRVNPWTYTIYQGADDFEFQFDIVTTLLSGPLAKFELQIAKAAGAPTRAVIGRMDDLLQPGALRPGEFRLADKLPNLGDPQLNYYQNMSALRQEMRRGVSIRDASAHKPDSFPVPTPQFPGRTVRQTFTGAERNQLRNRGWEFDGEYWNPPGG
jgi:RHS repeat-associated protein